MPFGLASYSQSLEDLIEQAGRYVVAIKGGAYRVQSGILFRPDLIATNSHPLRRDLEIPIRLPDGSEAQAELVGRDPGADLALLKVTGGAFVTPELERNERLRAGAVVFVIGRTLDAGLSASIGIVGAAGPGRRSWRGGQLDLFLRLDVNHYPSQVGAAVFSGNGLLVGMASPAMLRHSVLAIPHGSMNRIAESMLKDGRIRGQGYLGVGLQQVAIPEHLRMDVPRAGESGLIVLSVEPGTGAAEAGIQLGDIFLSQGETALTDTEDLLNVLRTDAVGKALPFTLLRGGSAIQKEIRIFEKKSRRR